MLSVTEKRSGSYSALRRPLVPPAVNLVSNINCSYKRTFPEIGPLTNFVLNMRALRGVDPGSTLGRATPKGFKRGNCNLPACLSIERKCNDR